MLNYNSLNINQQVTFIFQCIQFLVGLIGIIGNIIVFIVFSRPNLKKHSYSFYCRVLAIIDIGVFIFTFKNWASYVLEANLDIVSPFFCSINLFLIYILGGQSILMLTFITADRMLTIVYMNRFSFLKKRWFQWLIIFIGVVYNVLLNLMLPINNRLIEIDLGTNSSQSIKLCFLDTQIIVNQTWIHLANFFFLNILVNNILNIKIIWFIVSSRRKMARNSSNLSQSTWRDRKFAITSIGLNLAAMILKFPMTIAFLIMNTTVFSFDQIIEIQTIVITIAILDNGFSFIINFFVNSIFHDEFLALIGIRKENAISAPTRKSTQIQSVSSKTRL